MVTINVKNILGQTILPVPGTAAAAGYDLITLTDPKIVGEQLPASYNEPDWWLRIDYIEYATGLYIAPQPSHAKEYTYHTLIHPRSSVRKYNLVLANSIGLIDEDYRGELILCFKYIWQPQDFIWGSVKDSAKGDQAPSETMMLGRVNFDKIYKKGDAVGQLVAEGTNRINFNLVDDLTKTDRGEGGFGSTDALQKEHESIKILSAIKRMANIPPEGQDPKYLMPHNPVADQNGTDTTIKPTAKTGGFIVDAYNKAGGVPIKKRYSTEIKERQE